MPRMAVDRVRNVVFDFGGVLVRWQPQQIIDGFYQDRLLHHVRESLAPIPDSIALLRALEARGVPLYGLSNISVENFAHLRERDAHWGVFRGIVISAEVKMVKPEARIFEHLCQAHRLVPGETVFIDDLVANTEAAARLGFRTVLFRDAAQCAIELERLLAR